MIYNFLKMKKNINFYFISLISFVIKPAFRKNIQRLLNDFWLCFSLPQKPLDLMKLFLLVLMFYSYFELTHHRTMVRYFNFIDCCILFTMNIMFLLSIIKYSVCPCRFSLVIMLFTIFYITISRIKSYWVFMENL